MSEQKRSEVVVITGASAGIGRAAVREFARHGASIGLLARGQDGLEGTRREAEEMGSRVLAMPVDVADPNRLEAAAEAVERELGPIDVWINNAVLSVFAPFREITPEEFWRVTEVTYLGYVHGTQSALRRMLPRDRGTIVQVSSSATYRGIPVQSAYSGAQHAIRGFTEAVRTELMHDGSRVWMTMVQLPSINTPRFEWAKTRMSRKVQPMPPIYQPEVAARAIYYAAHHRRRELWVGMQTMRTILGNRVAPSLLDRYMARTGYESQMYDGAPDPRRQANLWDPVPGDQGAHGPFDEQARPTSPELWAVMHPVVAMAALSVLTAALMTGAGFLFQRVRNRSLR